MKLMYELSSENHSALHKSMGSEERLMYCIPFNIYEDRFVNGYTAVTNRYIYCLIDGIVVGKFDLSKASDFSAEVFYGNCAFTAKFDGVTTLICRFVFGRNRPRYAVLVNACEILAKHAADGTQPGAAITNSEEEHFCPICSRPFLRGTKTCPFCRKKKDVYIKLWNLTRGLRFMITFPLIVAVISVIFQFLIPAIEKVAINDFITNSAIYPISEHSEKISAFIAIIAAIVSIDLFQRAISVVQSRLSAVAGNRFTMMLRTLLYEKIEMLSISSITKKSTGDLMGRISNDVTVVQDFITNQLPTLFTQAFSFLVAFVVVSCIAPLATLFIFIPIPFVIFLAFKFKDSMRYRNAKTWMRIHCVNRLLQDTLNGIRVVKTFGSEEREISRFKEAQQRVTERHESDFRFFDTFFPMLSFVVYIGQYIILYYGNILLFNGAWSYGQIQQINSYSTIVYSPLMQITSLPRVFSQFMTSLTKVMEIVEEEPEISDIALPIDITIEGNVDFKNVSFGYESYDPVLENISFSVKQGEMIGIVGHSGSGKSTLINLLMRLYDVLEGEIIIDHVNIRDISQNALRSQIGIVLQETHLFSGSIRDNIRYSKPHATDEEVIAAARLANAHDFIVSLPEGYNTIIGEKGYSLSGGERQRVAIARALIHDPRMLILDEATAALDTESEKLIQDAINKLTKDRTTFAIAHRLSTLRNADRLIVLDHGKLVEIGTHAELLEKKGFYWRLVMAQRQDSGFSTAS